MFVLNKTKKLILEIRQITLLLPIALNCFFSACPQSKLLVSTSNQCENCPAGTYNNIPGVKTNCIACEAGKYSLAGSASCTDCEAGTYSIGGSAGCTLCEAGKYSSSGSATCAYLKCSDLENTVCGKYSWHTMCRDTLFFELFKTKFKGAHFHIFLII